MIQVAPVPGVVIGVIEDGKPSWIKPFGMRNVETAAPVTADTIFHAASLTKQVLAYAAFSLRDQGKLDFDRTLVSYVDDLSDPKARQVKIRHVLSHSSGFPNWRFEAGKLLVPEFEPGSKWRYSGEGFVYLQRILEKVTGEGIAAILDRLVFQPLRMPSSALVWSSQFADRTALPYNGRGELLQHWDRRPRALEELARKRGTRLRDWKYEEYRAAAKELGDAGLPFSLAPNGAASLVTTAADYGRFLASAIQNREIGKEQVAMRGGLAWGLGWGIERTKAASTSGSGGTMEASRILCWQNRQKAGESMFSPMATRGRASTTGS